MKSVEIKFTSDHIGNKTNYSNLTQTKIMQQLEEAIAKKEVLSVTVVNERLGEKHFCFPVMEEKINPVTKKKEWKNTGNLIIIADKRVCGNNANVVRLEQISKKISHVSYSNTTKIKKVGKFVLAVTGAAILTVGAVKGIQAGTEAFIEWDNENFAREQERIEQYYKDEHGNDVRDLSKYNYNGYFVQDEDGKFYIDDDGNKYLVDNEGKYHLVEEQIDNEEEKGKSF